MNKVELKELITKVATEIQPLLDPIPGKTRIAHAHIYGAVKTICGVTYTDADPEIVKKIVELVRVHPNADYEDIAEML